MVFAQDLNSEQRADSVQSRVPVIEPEQDLGLRLIEQCCKQEQCCEPVLTLQSQGCCECCEQEQGPEPGLTLQSRGSEPELIKSKVQTGLVLAAVERWGALEVVLEEIVVQ